jgi:GNAT superfamily N-acetyltransferase
MNFEPIKVDRASLKKCVDLFSECFPSASHITVPYLEWMYRDNPRGQVIGFNAIDKEKIVAHYACLPCELMLGGEKKKSLLAILSTTHPDYQGQGLFPKLANHTYESIDKQKFACVYGVGNANSTPSLVRKLGFQLVKPLDVKIGISQLSINWGNVRETSQFRRLWTEADIKWRALNQANPASIAKTTSGHNIFYADSVNSMIKVISPIKIDDNLTETLPKLNFFPKLFIGLFPKDSCNFREYINIPDRFKPSPLNMLYKPLHTHIKQLDPDLVTFGFQDFDAY